MTLFTNDQWLIVGLVFLLGLILGMLLLAGGKWKRRYREEARRTAELEKENRRLADEARELESLRHAAVKSDRRDLDRETVDVERRELERREADRREADRRVADRRDPL